MAVNHHTTIIAIVSECCWNRPGKSCTVRFAVFVTFGYWATIESYIKVHSEAEFSHSICSECTKKLYPEIDPS